MNIIDFANTVGNIVREKYGVNDGADLCFNLVEAGRIEISDGVQRAARIVAQHIVQA